MSHPDLVANINQELSIDFTGDNGPERRPDYLADTIFSHGTHVAGTIGAANSKLFLVPSCVALSQHQSHLRFTTLFRRLRNNRRRTRLGACLVSIELHQPRLRLLANYHGAQNLTHR